MILTINIIKVAMNFEELMEYQALWDLMQAMDLPKVVD
jgi:hypothetical protein